MNDPEVARLRRLRGQALRVREIARALGSTQRGNELLARGAHASWRIARLVSGRLKAHPYLRYQQGVGLRSIVVNRLYASLVAATAHNRAQALKRYESQLQALMRHLDDTRALSWSSDFSDALGRSQYEFQSLLEDLAPITESSLPTRGTRTEGLAGGLGRTVERDWPYLAF